MKHESPESPVVTLSLCWTRIKIPTDQHGILNFENAKDKGKLSQTSKEVKSTQTDSRQRIENRPTISCPSIIAWLSSKFCDSDFENNIVYTFNLPIKCKDKI